MAKGIGMVQQHFMLFENMTVAENIVFKNEIRKGPFMDRKRIINTVKEGVMLASASRRHNVSGLVDLYHMALEGDTIDNIRQVKGNLSHAHIANPFETKSGRKARSYPAGDDEYDYKGFIDALSYAGCKRCSVEASVIDLDSDMILSGKLFQNYK